MLTQKEPKIGGEVSTWKQGRVEYLIKWKGWSQNTIQKSSFTFLPILPLNSILFPHFGHTYDDPIKASFMHHSKTAFFPSTGNMAKKPLTIVIKMFHAFIQINPNIIAGHHGNLLKFMWRKK
ncbi:hypothetical protein TNCV_1283981 [Trichonephila clavipes]|uniref:Chromo domain-containing protein n=1 Tax=Trichonephila clavipes TaxID=2585209 RepID=A0A8X6SZQ0_TRICX|nr:hypothetical protein TNCV_1283981 [Trichonephila clavipes]